MYWLYAAATLTTFTLFVHVFGGGKTVATPLLESEMGDEAKFTNYYCWHIVTIVLASMAICFTLPALSIASNDLAILATLLAFAFAIWSIMLTVIKKLKILVLGQWILFLPIAIFGFLGAM